MSSSTLVPRKEKQKMGLPLWVDVKMHKTAQNSMEPKGRPWLHEPHGNKKAVSNKTNEKNGGRKNRRWVYPYGSTSKCTKPPKIPWSQRGALGSMRGAPLCKMDREIARGGHNNAGNLMEAPSFHTKCVSNNCSCAAISPTQSPPIVS